MFWFRFSHVLRSISFTSNAPLSSWECRRTTITSTLPLPVAITTGKPQVCPRLPVSCRFPIPGTLLVHPTRHSSDRLLNCLFCRSKTVQNGQQMLPSATAPRAGLCRAASRYPGAYRLGRIWRANTARAELEPCQTVGRH